MRQHPIPDDSWNEADAMRLIRGLRPAGGVRPQPVDQLRTLTRTVEEEVIPRLVRAHRLPPAETVKPAAATKLPSAAQLNTLVKLSLADAEAAATTYVLSLRRQGISDETLLLDLITPAARRLGVMWEDDICSFSDVTLGVLRLGQAVRALEVPASPDPGAPAALLAPMPGDSHGLGLAILAQIFRRAGWRVQCAYPRHIAELAAVAAAGHFDILGLSVTCDDQMGRLAGDIASVRQVSRNRGLFVLVGGAPFVVHPQLADMVGADATATDASHAVRQAHRLIAQAARA